MVTPAVPAGSRSRVVLAAVVALAVVTSALVAVQVLVGGVPVLERLLPSSRAALAVLTTSPPALDCGGRPASGGVVAAGGTSRDLATAAAEARDASPEAAVLVAAAGYRRAADAVDVVWTDSSGRARLVLSYVQRSGGWVLTARSGCAT